MDLSYELHVSIIFLERKHMTREIHLSERVDLICCLAHCTLVSTMGELFSNSITIAKFKILFEKRDQVKILSKASPEFKSRHVNAALEQKHKELEEFNDYKRRLTSFCHDVMLGKLKIPGKKYILCIVGSMP